MLSFQSDASASAAKPFEPLENARQHTCREAPDRAISTRPEPAVGHIDRALRFLTMNLSTGEREAEEHLLTWAPKIDEESIEVRCSVMGFRPV